jgi:hypothetical protein
VARLQPSPRPCTANFASPSLPVPCSSSSRRNEPERGSSCGREGQRTAAASAPRLPSSTSQRRHAAHLQPPSAPQGWPCRWTVPVLPAAAGSAGRGVCPRCLHGWRCGGAHHPEGRPGGGHHRRRRGPAALGLLLPRRPRELERRVRHRGPAVPHQPQLRRALPPGPRQPAAHPGPPLPPLHQVWRHRAQHRPRHHAGKRAARRAVCIRAAQQAERLLCLCIA